MVEMTMGGVVIPNYPCCHPERREGSQCNGGGSSGGKKRKRREISPDGRDDNGGRSSRITPAVIPNAERDLIVMAMERLFWFFQSHLQSSIQNAKS
jgi:hypothetical protein